MQPAVDPKGSRHRRAHHLVCVRLALTAAAWRWRVLRRKWPAVNSAGRKRDHRARGILPGIRFDGVRHYWRWKWSPARTCLIDGWARRGRSPSRNAGAEAKGRSSSRPPPVAGSRWPASGLASVPCTVGCREWFTAFHEESVEHLLVLMADPKGQQRQLRPAGQLTRSLRLSPSGGAHSPVSRAVGADRRGFAVLLSDQ